MATTKTFHAAGTAGRQGVACGTTGKTVEYDVIAYMMPSSQELKLYRYQNRSGDGYARQLTTMELASMRLTDDVGAPNWVYQLDLAIRKIGNERDSHQRSLDRLEAMLIRFDGVTGVEQLDERAIKQHAEQNNAATNHKDETERLIDVEHEGDRYKWCVVHEYTYSWDGGIKWHATSYKDYFRSAEWYTNSKRAKAKLINRLEAAQSEAKRRAKGGAA